MNCRSALAPDGVEENELERGSVLVTGRCNDGSKREMRGRDTGRVSCAGDSDSTSTSVTSWSIDGAISDVVDVCDTTDAMAAIPLDGKGACAVALTGDFDAASTRTSASSWSIDGAFSDVTDVCGTADATAAVPPDGKGAGAVALTGAMAEDDATLRSVLGLSLDEVDAGPNDCSCSNRASRSGDSDPASTSATSWSIDGTVSVVSDVCA